MKVMSFNLRVNVESDGQNAWSYRSDKVAAMIAKHAPLVVGTQEGTSDMINDVLTEIPEYDFIGVGRDVDCTGEMTAILYKKSELKCVQTGVFWLSEAPEVPGSTSWETEFPRTCTWGKFQTLNGKSEFYVVNTHLDHISQEARVHGMNMITYFIQKHIGTLNPVFLMGDFNVTPDNEVIQQLNNIEALRNSYGFLDGEVGATFHDFEGGVEGDTIDYIYVTKAIEAESVIVDRSEFDGAFPSDHYPVVISVSNV